jgi:hypothetical protein
MEVEEIWKTGVLETGNRKQIARPAFVRPDHQIRSDQLIHSKDFTQSIQNKRLIKSSVFNTFDQKNAKVFKIETL